METFRFLMATTFYPPYHLGGDAVHVQYLAEALAARGHEVHVEFSPAAYRLKRRGKPAATATNDAVHVHAIPSPLGRAQPVAAHVLGEARSVTRFHRALTRKLRPDVVHLHNISLLGLGVLRRPSRGRMLYTAHDYWARCPRSDLMKNGTRLCETPTCASCALASHRPVQLWRYAQGWRGFPGLDRAIAPSRFIAQALASSFACPIVHVPNFAPDPNPSGTIAEPGGYFLFVGVLEPHKGVLDLAAAAMKGTFNTRIVGSGSLAASLRTLANESSGRVTVEGRVSPERLQDLYRHANALIVPSRWHEVAPLVAIEALAWGTPLLVSRRGGLRELLYSGATGRSFEPTPADLAAAVERFEAEGLSRTLRVRARSAYAMHHRTETYIDRYLAVVRDCGTADAASPERTSTLTASAAHEAIRGASEGGLP